MTALAKKPLCVDCRENGGWLYDETGDQAIVTPCPCRTPSATPGQQRDRALTGAAEANPNAMRAALAIIRDAAKANPVLSSNLVRHEMRLAQIPGPVVGAAFRQAAKDKVLRKIGYVPSLDGPTHAHPIAEWESLLFGRTA